MTKNQSFTTSRRNVLRGSALAGGLVLGSGLAGAAPSIDRANAATAEKTASPDESLTIVDYFLKLDGIDGESQDSTHKGWIDIESFSFSASNSTKPASTKAGKVSRGPMHFTKVVDATSPTLMTHCMNGKHINSATLSMRASNAKADFLTITLTGVVISNYAESATSNETPTESISLNFTKIEIKYSTQNAD